jgi:hypothetical protein
MIPEFRKLSDIGGRRGTESQGLRGPASQFKNHLFSGRFGYRRKLIYLSGLGRVDHWIDAQSLAGKGFT